MPRLSDLLAYLAEPAPAARGVWLLLDIKTDDDAETMVRHLAATITPAADWCTRVVLGCWTARHVALCRALMPAFSVAWIGIALPLAREYLAVGGVGMNVRVEVLYGVGGAGFLRHVRAEGAGGEDDDDDEDVARRPVFAWTVNSVGWMRWAVDAGLDAVVTDDPRLFLEVCGRYREGEWDKGDGGGGGGGLVGWVKGWVVKLGVPLLVRLATWKFGYYERVGGPEVTREILRTL